MVILPNADDAIIPIEKFTDYVLNPVKEPNKSGVFDKALGYNLNNADDLIKNIRANIKNFSAKMKKPNGYGDRYEILMTLIGPTGKTANIKTAWLYEYKTKKTKLTSAYITSKKFKKE